MTAFGGLWLFGAGCASPVATVTPPRERADAGVTFDGSVPTGDLSPPDADAGKAPPVLACPPSPFEFKPPPAYVPATAHQGLCTPPEIAAFISACVTPGLDVIAWNDANIAGAVPGGEGTPCGNCLFGKKDNGGVWLDPDQLFYPNFGACMQLLDPVHGAACAHAYDDAVGCRALACEYCPGAGPNDLSDCLAVADTTICASYTAAVNEPCAEDLSPGGLFDTCDPDNGGPEAYTFVATLICGFSPADAAAD